MTPTSKAGGRAEVTPHEVLRRGLTTGESTLKPAVAAWSETTVVALRRVLPDPGLPRVVFFDDLLDALAATPIDVRVLAAELLYLDLAPRVWEHGDKRATELARYTVGLNLTEPSLGDLTASLAEVPFNAQSAGGMRGLGSKTYDWLISFIARWMSQPRQQREETFGDPCRRTTSHVGRGTT